MSLFSLLCLTVKDAQLNILHQFMEYNHGDNLQNNIPISYLDG